MSWWEGSWDINIKVSGQLLVVAINVDMDDHLEFVSTFDELSIDGAHDVESWYLDGHCPFQWSSLEGPASTAELCIHQRALLVTHSLSGDDEPKVLLDLHAHFSNVPASARAWQGIKSNGDGDGGSMVKSLVRQLDEVVEGMFKVGCLLDWINTVRVRRRQRLIDLDKAFLIEV